MCRTVLVRWLGLSQLYNPSGNCGGVPCESRTSVARNGIGVATPFLGQKRYDTAYGGAISNFCGNIDRFVELWPENDTMVV